MGDITPGQYFFGFFIWIMTMVVFVLYAALSRTSNEKPENEKHTIRPGSPADLEMQRMNRILDTQGFSGLVTHCKAMNLANKSKKKFDDKARLRRLEIESKYE
jgi:hypothetical protein